MEKQEEFLRMTKNSILQNSYRRKKNEEISNLILLGINTFRLR